MVHHIAQMLLLGIVQLTCSSSLLTLEKNAGYQVNKRRIFCLVFYDVLGGIVVRILHHEHQVHDVCFS